MRSIWRFDAFSTLLSEWLLSCLRIGLLRQGQTGAPSRTDERYSITVLQLLQVTEYITLGAALHKVPDIQYASALSILSTR